MTVATLRQDVLSSIQISEHEMVHTAAEMQETVRLTRLVIEATRASMREADRLLKLR